MTRDIKVFLLSLGIVAGWVALLYLSPAMAHAASAAAFGWMAVGFARDVLS
jgi:hypothetical protein